MVIVLGWQYNAVSTVPMMMICSLTLENHLSVVFITSSSVIKVITSKIQIKNFFRNNSFYLPEFIISFFHNTEPYEYSFASVIKLLLNSMLNDIRTICTRLDELRLSGEPCALATIVSVHGSAYRRPGARMLFSKNGREAGFVSAACLEADLFEKVKEVIALNKAALFSYDTTAPEDAIFGIGQGCGGVVEILVEPIGGEQTTPLMGLLQMLRDLNEPCAVAMVYKSNGEQRETFGARLFLTLSGNKSFTLTQTELSQNITSDVEEALHTGKSVTKQYNYSCSTADVFIEIIQPPVHLLLFGATPDVRPLVRLAAELGWNSTVVDHRAAYAVKKDFPEADEVILIAPEEYDQQLRISPETFAVIMVHQFAAEAKALRFLLSSTIRYVGLLGPKSKCELLLQHLSAEGFTPTEEQRARLHNPVGLDIGAETSEEIALSISAEILTRTRNRNPGFLKDRQGAIH
jgi:xanthine/CO dehydrogenase XdhC/CoxF family maturation factor